MCDVWGLRRETSLVLFLGKGANASKWIEGKSVDATAGERASRHKHIKSSQGKCSQELKQDKMCGNLKVFLTGSLQDNKCEDGSPKVFLT
jgi:hypothetical protein